jgi:hypothetical protein
MSVRRFQVTITYQVDIATKAEGSQLVRNISAMIDRHVRGEDSAHNLVEEVDFAFKQITHPKDSDRRH